MRGIVLAITCLGAGAAVAAEPARPRPADASTVSELVIMPEAKCLAARQNLAARAPRIVSTFPANDAVVRPGLLVVRITFDRAMSCSGFFMERQPLRAPCPASRQKMVLSFNRRTVRLLCETTANTTYGLGIGDEAGHAFISLEGRPAAPEDLIFTTSDGPAVETVPEALAQDR